MKQSEVKKAPTFTRLVQRPVYRFSKWLTIISAIAACTIMVLTTVDVLMRRFLNMPISGSLEISTSLLVVLVFCCVAWVMTKHGHVVVDMISRKYPQRLGDIISGIAHFLSMIIVALMCWGSIKFGLDQASVGEASVLIGLPVAPFIFVLAFGCALLFLVILIQFINVLVGLKED